MTSGCTCVESTHTFACGASSRQVRIASENSMWWPSRSRTIRSGRRRRSGALATESASPTTSMSRVARQHLAQGLAEQAPGLQRPEPGPAWRGRRGGGGDRVRASMLFPQVLWGRADWLTRPPYVWPEWVPNALPRIGGFRLRAETCRVGSAAVRIARPKRKRQHVPTRRTSPAAAVITAVPEADRTPRLRRGAAYAVKATYVVFAPLRPDGAPDRDGARRGAPATPRARPSGSRRSGCCSRARRGRSRGSPTR